MLAPSHNNYSTVEDNLSGSPRARAVCSYIHVPENAIDNFIAETTREDEIKGRKSDAVDEPEDDQSPVEEVALTVPTTDDPSTPVWTFRMWALGVFSCFVLAFLNQFFAYRTEPLVISAVCAQIAALPLGRLLAASLPSRKWLRGSMFEFSLNPGPFNMKEHVLITIFANAGAGGAYAIGIVIVVKAFYGKRISSFAGLAITITTQVNSF